MLSTFIQKLIRKKHVTLDDTELPRVLNLFDLTCMGIGSTIGIGFYVLAGEVSRNVAGPAVVLCFLIAGIASVFSGLCYAEFGARVPKAGSAYVYSYVCVGEFVAFVIGWNLLLEYIIGTSSVAKGYSTYIDELANNVMSDALHKVMPIDVSFLNPFPDFLAFGISFAIAIILALGVKESIMFNNLCTGLNLIVVVYTIITAATQADPYNWRIPEDRLNETCTQPSDDGHDWGVGGFAPYGFAGIMQGAATCFFGFVGFDCIATTGEEAIRPSRNIPLAISISLLFIFLAYFGLGTTLTLALPYCMQNAEAPLVDFFEQLGWEASKWFVSIGALFGFSASLLGVLLPLPRILYAMAEDGIIFQFLGRINKRFKTPAIATILSGLFAGVMAMIFNLKALVDMMSIGTLLAYTIVALSVMLLRYSVEDDIVLKDPSDVAEDGEQDIGALASKDDPLVFSCRSYINQLFNTQRLKEPTALSASLVNYATISFCLTSSLVVLLIVVLGKDISQGDAGAIAGLVVSIILALINVLVIACQPQSQRTLPFKVPFVPWLPAISSVINLYLMFNLTKDTWIRFGIWMGIGLPLYFLYGLRNSKADNWKSVHNQGIDNPAGPLDEKETGTVPVVVSPPEMTENHLNKMDSKQGKSSTRSSTDLSQPEKVPHVKTSLATEESLNKDPLSTDEDQVKEHSESNLSRNSTDSIPVFGSVTALKVISDDTVDGQLKVTICPPILADNYHHSDLSRKELGSISEQNEKPEESQITSSKDLEIQVPRVEENEEYVPETRKSSLSEAKENERVTVPRDNAEINKSFESKTTEGNEGMTCYYDDIPNSASKENIEDSESKQESRKSSKSNSLSSAKVDIET
ncbi:high affinity cationic amino acid transporter 1-like [Palaemon carinicauda]|uniref:high affinity cationic amino acid transporter 1-like n=1 Tax=Palaemon carinicauda TaxID=392227 RepID=UPI0035B5BB4F